MLAVESGSEPRVLSKEQQMRYLVLAVIVVAIAVIAIGTRQFLQQSGEEKGQPSPHALDQSQ